ncbi:MAG: PGF-pre-PGF domain-containing protein [Methanosarcina sp.]|jgi:PGF-pre-PGF domain-containing protein|nr:PGF-pre-PGF domain-containing protein [Methanosarcina sp.]MDD4305096.1 PGF-pre-PGF domain-containing protein [Methanosarcina sp.]
MDIIFKDKISGGGKLKSKILFTAFTLIFLMGVTPTVSARDIIVSNGSGSGYTIQEAVDSAEAGDVIIIKPGTYIENVNVSKAGLTIKPETSNVVIQPTDGSIATVTISNVGVTLTGLNVHGDVIVSTWASDRSFEYQINNPTYITNNVVENGGIKVGSESSAVTISGNLISGNGIDVSCCGEYNTIVNNEISNSVTGIYVYDERNVPPISGNKISNCNTGIHVSGLSYDIINNEITNCGKGIVAGETGGATLVGNKITYCTDCGLEASGYLGTNYNNYFNNTVNVKIGEYGHIIAWNTALTSGTNIVGGSYIGGNYWAKPDGTGFSQTAVDANGDGIADSAYVIAENNIDYLPLTVKYNSVLPTSDFTANITSGTAPLVVQFTDISTEGAPNSWYWDFGDGINSKHAMNATHTFTKPGNYTISLIVENAAGNSTATKPGYIVVTDSNVPVADFNSNVTEGYAPLTVQFYDLSQKATSRIWDFNSDGHLDSSDINPVYVYANTGTYTVNLTVNNANGAASKIAAINVLTQSNSSGGNNGGSSHKSGGSSGGGSPEPAKNVEVKELSQVHVASGKPVKFDFPKNVTCVAYVSFDAKKTAGKTTTIAEQLKAKSTLASNLSSGEVYKYFNLWVGNAGFATEKNIENPVVCFKVEKSWLEDKNIDRNSVTLDRYSDKKWSELPVKLLKEDSKYLYLTAETPGFTYFAITGKAVEKENVAETKHESGIESLRNNTENVTVSVEQTSKQKESAASTPGFKMIYGIIGLIGLFLCRIR